MTLPYLKRKLAEFIAKFKLLEAEKMILEDFIKFLEGEEKL